MPRNSRETEIVKAIRSYLEDAVKGEETITDEKLMKVAQCSRATFYKYVKEGSAIEGEIERARRIQESTTQTTGKASPREDAAATIKRLRTEAEIAKEGAKELAAVQVRFVSNLIELGVSASIIDRAQRAAMSKPDRSVSRAGYPRNKKLKRGRFS